MTTIAPAPPRRLFAIVLAAGEGKRMGGPKARLLAEGRKLLDLHACRLHEVGCLAIVLVVRPPFASVPHPFAWTVPALTTTPAESLAIGLESLAARTALDPLDLVFVTPVDMFPPHPSTFHALVSTLAATPAALAATPTHSGRGGHPVLTTAATLHASRGQPLRQTLRDLGPLRLRIPVPDRAILDDFDTPADWGRPPRFAGSP